MMRSLFSSLSLLSFLLIACGPSEGSGTTCPGTGTPNDVACPARAPAAYSPCSPKGIRCAYPGTGTPDANGCTKPVVFQCLVEGPDGGSSAPAWWPAY